MKVFVIGATGRVGQETVQALVNRGHQVTAAGRDMDKITESEHVETVRFDLEDDTDHLASLLKGHDAIIFTAGSRNTNLLKVDAYGVVKATNAAKRANIKRFILLGAKWAAYPRLWSHTHIKEAVESLDEYYIAKYFANIHLMQEEELDYTIVEPDQLEEKEGTGMIEINNMEAVGTPIPDVAEVLAACVDNDKTINKVYTINTGVTPIEDALNNEGPL